MFPSMQPPPRKVKETHHVKQVFSVQLSKLQDKQQLDIELLEEIRSFSKQRAAVERDYAQALQSLAFQYQRRDWERAGTDVCYGVLGVWRSLIDATAQTAASRLASVDEYRVLIKQASKSIRDAKDSRAKRALEVLQKMQSEVVDGLQDVHRIKKRYHHLGHIANAARQKAADAQARARSDHGIFFSKTGLQKMNAKLNARFKECDNHLTEVRNEYLLALAAARSHYRHFSTSDLPQIMELIDGDIYENLRSHFSVLCDAEMDACLNTHKQYSVAWDAIAKMTRKRDVQQFQQDLVFFAKTPEFSFQPAPQDNVTVLQEINASQGEGSLVQEARRWITKAATDYKLTRHGEKTLQTLESRLKLLSGETGFMVEQKITEVQDSIRKARLSRVKAEARLALLSESVEGLEGLLCDAMKLAEEELQAEGRLSAQRTSAEDFSEEELEPSGFADYDAKRALFPEPASELHVYPAAYKVIYSYQAGPSDELSMLEGDDVEATEDGDVEDWLKVCNMSGQIGFIPERYVQFIYYPTEGTSRLDTSADSAPSRRIKDRPESRCVARALYSYKARSDRELSFQEGALIQLTHRQDAEVDDGFWEGELNGRMGLFPSLLVEILHDEELDVDEELPDGRKETGDARQTSPPPSSGRPRPCRAPPPPPPPRKDQPSPLPP